MSDKAFIQGFVKRAADYGINEAAAHQLAKQAFFAKAQQMAGDAMNSMGQGIKSGVGALGGMAQQAGGAIGGMVKNLGFDMGAKAPSDPSMQPSYGIGGGMYNPMHNPMAPQAVNQATQQQMQQRAQPQISAPAPAPAAPQQPDLQSQFAKYHGSAFDPKSKMDQWKLQQMQQAQQNGGSIVQASNQRYPGRA